MLDQARTLKQKTPRMTKFLTVAEVAVQLGVSRDTVRRMIQTGQLPALNIAAPGSRRPTYRVDAESVNLLSDATRAGNLIVRPYWDKS